MGATKYRGTHVRSTVDKHRQRIANATDRLELEEVRTDPLDLLQWARWLVAEASQLEEAAVIEARQAGASWSAIGSVHGMTKQAAWDRWHQLDKLVDKATTKPPAEPWTGWSLATDGGS